MSEDSCAKDNIGARAEGAAPAAARSAAGAADGGAAAADGGAGGAAGPRRAPGEAVGSSGGAVGVDDLVAAIARRHSVRSYTDRRIEGATRDALEAEIAACNREGGLRMRLVLDEPEAFGGMMARYGSFRNVRNYVALIGQKADDLDERAGYFGERVALAAQALGLNTCWVALTFRKRRVRHLVGPGESLVCVLAVGYGATQGKPRKSKAFGEVSRADGTPPSWFGRGVQAALAAPTAMNQQRFRFHLGPDGETVRAEADRGAYTALDLGIAKLHFELGAGRENFSWG